MFQCLVEKKYTQLSVINNLPLFHISAAIVPTLKYSTPAILVLVTIEN